MDDWYIDCSSWFTGDEVWSPWKNCTSIGILTNRLYFNRVRVSLLLLSHIPETLQAGSNCLLNPLLSKLSSTPERVWLHLKSVFCWEMLTVLLKLVLSLVTRSWESWSQTVWLQKFQKTCTTWLERLSPLESTWKETERTRMLNSDWFWSNPESTDWQDTTELSLFCHQPGSTNLLLLPLWWTKVGWCFL